MDKAVILGNVKLITGAGSDKDSLLTLLIDRALEQIRSFCNDTFDQIIDNLDGTTTTIEYGLFPKELEGALEELVVTRFRLLGYEGKTSERLGDYQVNLQSIPSELKSRLYPYRQIRVV